jgi:hypothetical protein
VRRGVEASEGRERVMLSRWFVIEDDRGRPVPLVRPDDLRDGLTDFQRRELRMVVPHRPVEFVLKIVGLILLMQVVGAAWVYFTQGIQPKASAVRIMVHLGVVSTLFLSIALVHWFVRRRRAVGRCLRWGVCASCGYSLRDAIEHDDGCVVCSECGAAWKAWRVGAAARE